MKYFSQISILGLNLFMVALGYMLSHLEIFGLCRNTYSFGTYIGCSDQIIEAIGQPLLLFSLIILPVSFIFLFLNRRVLSIWKKFTLWWLFLSAILILATPTSSNTWMPLYSLEREGVTWIMGILFVLISIGLIVWKGAKK